MAIESQSRTHSWAHSLGQGLMVPAGRLAHGWSTGAGVAASSEAPLRRLQRGGATEVNGRRRPRRGGFRPVAAMEIGLAVGEIALEFDALHGGFGVAPKYPHADRHELLLSYYRWTGDQGAIRMVLKSLDAMITGALYDHVGGGFFRYCTDEGWTEPCCEKSLADNALLARLYLRAHESTGAQRYARVARHTLNYVLRTLSAPDGGLYSSEGRGNPDALSEYYGWKRDDIRDLLRPGDVEPFCLYYGIGHGAVPACAAAGAQARPATTVLRIAQPLGLVAARLGRSEEEVLAAIRRGRRRLRVAQADRGAPGRDHTIRTALNGLMISALADGYRLLGEGAYLRAANRIADFVLTQHSDGAGGLLRASRDDRRDEIPELEDWAMVCDGLLDLHEVSAGADQPHVRAATSLALRMCEDFGAVGGGFYSAHRRNTAREQQRRGLVARDGQIPCGNAVAARVMARLADYHHRGDYVEMAVQALMAVGEHVARSPRACCGMLGVAVDLCERGLYRGAVL